MKFLGLVISFFLISLTVNAQAWEPMADLPESLTFPVVVVLDGKIHMMGGGGEDGASTAHYQFDPKTNNWLNKAAVPYAAQQPAGAVAGGRIHYFGGGFPNSGTPLSDHYAYDPFTDEWEQLSGLEPARAIHYGGSINDSLFCMAGQGVTDRFEFFDLDLNSWTVLDALPDTHFWYSGQCTHDNKLYRFGGGPYAAPKNFASQFDPTSTNWSNLSTLPQALHAPAAASFNDKIYISGGYINGNSQNTMVIYDPVLDDYELGLKIPEGRYYHQMVSIDNCLYIIGGSNEEGIAVEQSIVQYCLEEPVSIQEFESSKIESFQAQILNNTIQLELPMDWMDKDLDGYLYSLSGEQLNLNIQNTVSQKIDLPSLPAGQYILSIASSDKQFGSLRFILP